MADNVNLLAEWIREVKDELKERRDEDGRIWKDLRKLWIAHEKLETKVDTRNKIFWALVIFLFGAAGTIIALISLLNKLR